ncbi:MAG TPA: WYL domain-containing transcriptional regulator [Candidatus Paceibacterota bacterium]|nr:WYL domain-containing transcriptional regulator [Verrucomicrobiota bacterium]HSA09634.1 WYL domain-containing transcriptional regulator [Candidatus Paceibacterota bacterium]
MRKAQTTVYCWPAIERMMRIHQLIENREYPNSHKLAREFEMSVRTIKRDIDFMKTRLKLPMEFDGKKNGFYFTRSVPQFPQMPMSEADVFTMFVASKAIEQYRGTPWQRMLEVTFRKVTGQLDQSVRYSLGSMDGLLSFRPFAPGDAELKNFNLLMRAVSEKRAVKFMSRNRGQVKAQLRHVRPYHIACVDNQWCVFGFDMERKAMRTFVLTRLSKPTLTGKRFTVSKKFDLNEYLRGSLGLFKGQDDFEVVVELDAFAADDVRGRRLHSSQELTEMPGGMLRVRLRLDSLEEAERWVLSLGTHATVIRPEKLRERLFKATGELWQRYGGPMVMHNKRQLGI